MEIEKSSLNSRTSFLTGAIMAISTDSLPSPASLRRRDIPCTSCNSAQCLQEGCALLEDETPQKCRDPNCHEKHSCMRRNCMFPGAGE